MLPSPQQIEGGPGREGQGGRGIEGGAGREGQVCKGCPLLGSARKCQKGGRDGKHDRRCRRITLQPTYMMLGH